MTSPHAPGDAAQREQRLLAMLRTVSRSLSGALSVPEAIVEITAAMRDLLDFERIAVLRLEGEGVMRVHAAAHGVSWTEGREIRREDCSPTLWIQPLDRPRIADTHRELDIAFAMDREILERGTRSILRVPLVGRSGPIGALAVSSTETDAFDDQDERTASAIAGLVALALEHERLFEDEVRRRSRLAALDAVLPEVAEVQVLDDTAAMLDRITASILPHDAVSVGILHPDGAHIHSILDGVQRVIVDPSRKLVEDQMAALGPTGYVRTRDIEILDEAAKIARFRFVRGEKEFIRDIALDAATWPIRAVFGIRSQIRVAVRRGDETIGIIAFNSRKPDAYSEEDAAIARRLAERVSLTLAQNRLLDESRRAAEASARAAALEARVDLLQRELEAARGPHAVVGTSKSWRDVLAQATRVAGTDTTVLLTGESGTGKEVVARFLHHASPRAGGPFVAINCAALPEQLLEAELFGHEKGAFTGAAGLRIGRVEQAAGGVLFLDEVGEMSPSVQAKFLRVLQEREFQRLGSVRAIKADVRVIAATNRDLRAAIAAGDFREDLFYRLHVFAIHLPPLRERPEDVLVLADHFVKELGATLGSGAAGMTAEARDALQHYAWPGNARELRNVIERALILSDGGLIHPDHLAFAPGMKSGAAAVVPGNVAAGTVIADVTAGLETGSTAAGDVAVGTEDAGSGTGLAFDPLGGGPFPAEGVDLEAMERILVQRALAQVDGNKSKAARLLGLTRAQLYSRLEKYSL